MKIAYQINKYNYNSSSRFFDTIRVNSEDIKSCKIKELQDDNKVKVEVNFKKSIKSDVIFSLYCIALDI